MIIVRTEDHANGVKMTLSGHASEGDGSPEAKTLKDEVCASTSTMTIMLITICDGSYGGDKSGYATCVVPPKLFNVLEFVLAALRLLDQEYPGHIALEVQDSQIFSDPETAQWLHKSTDTAIQQVKASNDRRPSAP